MKKGQPDELRPVDLVEKAVGLLRAHALALLLPYWLGTLPFVLGLLYFWSDLSRHAVTAQQCAEASLGLALLYAWMKAWQARFGAAVSRHLTGARPERWPFRRWLRAAASQAVYQASGLLLLPVAAVLAVPLAWVFAYYQNVSVLESGDAHHPSIRNRLAWEQAQLWPGQNHLLLLILSCLGLVLFVNVALAIFILPVLLKKLLAVETVFSLSGTHVLNTTFLFTTAALTYLALDPLVKTVYALRCHHGRALGTGDDLRARLQRWVRHTSTLVAVAVLASGFQAVFAPAPAAAQSASLVETAVTPQQLDRHITEALNDRRFSWRLPNPNQPVDEPGGESGWLATLLEWIGQTLKKGVEVLSGWWRALTDWLDRLFPDPQPVTPEKSVGRSTPFAVILYATGAVLALALAAYLWRRRKRPDTGQPQENQVETVVPDLSADEVAADALPSDRWLELAAELAAKGRLRLALRAHYLSGLAHLGADRFLALAAHKTNLDYRRELARRAAAHHDLQQAFGQGVRSFESAWYGMHTVTPAALDSFARNQERIRRFEGP